MRVNAIYVIRCEPYLLATEVKNLHCFTFRPGPLSLSLELCHLAHLHCATAQQSHPFFSSPRGISALRDILIAFSARRPDIGYCQSMNFLAGILLLFYQHEAVPEKAFWMMVALVDVILPSDYYTPSMKGIHVDVMVFQRLLDKKLPAISAHLKKHSIELEIVCISWFLCLFLNSMPIETVLRVWDALFVEGSKIMFRIGLALFQLNEERILALSDDAGGMYAVVKSLPKSMYDCDLLMQTAFGVKSLGKSDIDSLRSECRHIVDFKFAQMQQARADYQQRK